MPEKSFYIVNSSKLIIIEIVEVFAAFWLAVTAVINSILTKYLYKNYNFDLCVLAAFGGMVVSLPLFF